MVEIPVSIKRTYRLFYIASAIFFINAAGAFLIDRIDMVIGLAAVAVALFALGNAIKIEEIKWLWWGRARSQRLELIQDGINEIKEKIDEILKLLKKEKSASP